MILLSLLKQLENDGLGVIDTSLFYEENPIDPQGNPREGIWVVSRSAGVSRFNTNIQNFDIYTRFKNKLVAGQKSKQVLDLLKSYYSLCDLPAVPPYTSGYRNVTIVPSSGVSSLGSDEQDNMIYVISGQVNYDILEA